MSALEPIEVVVARAASGDRAAKQALFEQHGRRLLASVIGPILRDSSRAEDALCETFISAFEALPRLSLPAGADAGPALFAWLAQIARRKAIDLLRRDQRDARLGEALLAEEGVKPAAILAADALAAEERARLDRVRVEAVLGEIHPRYAEAIRLRLFEERDREACAEALGVRVATFDVVLHRALRAFRAAFEARYGLFPEER